MEHLSFGVLAASFPAARIDAILERTGRASQRQRDLPARVVVYYVIALGLYMSASTQAVLSYLVEGLQWLCGACPLKVPTSGGISQARTRLGAAPLEALWRELCTQPLGQAQTPGVFYGPWRVVSLDGSTLEVADSPANSIYFGRQTPPGRGHTAYPQLRWVALAECGTHAILGAVPGPYTQGEHTLAGPLLEGLQADMLCLADRGFYSYELWKVACATGARLLWRMRKNQLLKPLEGLPDGSYLAQVYPGSRHPRAKHAILVRVIEYRLENQPADEPPYRLLTNILDSAAAPALELAALYTQRWEIEGAFDEVKTHLRGRQVVLRSKSPELVHQEFWGLLLGHWMIRQLMVQAAAGQGLDPDRISFTHGINIVQRILASQPGFFPSGPGDLAPAHQR